MKNENRDLEHLLRRALRSTEEPEDALVRKVKYQLSREKTVMKKRRTPKRAFGAIAATVAVFMLMGTTAFAAWHFLKPGEIAGQFGNKTLSEAFEKDMAGQSTENPSVTSGGYTFTLLGVLSGEDITDMPYYSENVQKERTYAVLAIQNADGTPMSSTADADYGKTSFFASPLVKGLKPWEVNVFTMNGGYTETVVDGVMYRLVECDGVSIFADRGLYFAVSTGTFYDTDAFIYNEQTGEVSANKSFDGASAVFDLKMDPSLADPKKAAEYLASITAPAQEPASEDNGAEVGSDFENAANWEEAVPVPGTEKELSVAADGSIIYSYETDSYGSGTLIAMFDDCFTDDPAPQSKIVGYMSCDDTMYAARFSKDENGVITGAIVIPK